MHAGVRPKLRAARAQKVAQITERNRKRQLKKEKSTVSHHEPEAGWYFELGQAAQAFKNAAVTLMSLCATQAPPSQASQVAVIRPGVAAVSTTLNQARLEV